MTRLYVDGHLWNVEQNFMKDGAPTVGIVVLPVLAERRRLRGNRVEVMHIPSITKHQA